MSEIKISPRGILCTCQPGPVDSAARLADWRSHAESCPVFELRLRLHPTGLVSEVSWRVSPNNPLCPPVSPLDVLDRFSWYSSDLALPLHDAFCEPVDPVQETNAIIRTEKK